MSSLLLTTSPTTKAATTVATIMATNLFALLFSVATVAAAATLALLPATSGGHTYLRPAISGAHHNPPLAPSSFSLASVDDDSDSDVLLASKLAIV